MAKKKKKLSGSPNMNTLKTNFKGSKMTSEERMARRQKLYAKAAGAGKVTAKTGGGKSSGGGAGASVSSSKSMASSYPKAKSKKKAGPKDAQMSATRRSTNPKDAQMSATKSKKPSKVAASSPTKKNTKKSSNLMAGVKKGMPNKPLKKAIDVGPPPKNKASKSTSNKSKAASMPSRLAKSISSDPGSLVSMAKKAAKGPAKKAASSSMPASAKASNKMASVKGSMKQAASKASTSDKKMSMPSKPLKKTADLGAPTKKATGWFAEKQKKRIKGMNS